MGSIIDVFLPLALAYVMFSVGIGLKFSDFRHIGSRPRDFFVGLLCQVALLPLIGFIVIYLWAPRPEIAMGVMLIVAAPGGPSSNLFTKLGRGDVALSVSLTVVVSLLCLVTIPLVIGLSYQFLFDEKPIAEISLEDLAIRLFLMATLPVLLGMVFRQVASGIAIRLEPSLLKGAALVFALVIAAAVYGQRDNLPGYFAEAGMVTLVLNLAILGIAALVGHFLASGRKQMVAITIECGIQNGTLAIALAVTMFDGGIFVIPAATYSLIKYFTLLLVIFYFRRIN